jgi:hypothetical protein
MSQSSIPSREASQSPTLTETTEVTSTDTTIERLFSSAKLMLPPIRNQTQPAGMEAGEYIQS